MKKYILNIGVFLSVCSPLWSQTFEIDKISSAKPVKVSGGINANLLSTYGINNENSPLNYYISGYLNFSFFQSLNLPVMVNYTDRKVALSQGYRFNQVSIHPSYKWATAHIGTTAMSFSPYTLNGHQFTGAGLELSPGNWRIQVMSGRLLKGQHEDTLNTGPTFKRTGYGYRLEYSTAKFTLGTTLFKASDHQQSLPQEYRIFNDQVLNPGENTVAGLHFSTLLFKQLQLSGEYANSLITKDSSPGYEKVKLRTLASAFHASNGTTESGNALKLAANYHYAATRTTIGLGYERVDPNYTTYGGYYFVNDLVNYTFNFNQQVSGDKIMVSGNVGFQKDDIQKTKLSKQSRLVANINAQANLSDKLQMGVNFSNFRSYKFLNDTYSRIERIPNQVIDTLDYSLVSQTLGFNILRKITKTEEKETGLGLNSSYVASKNIHGEENSGKTDIINSTFTFSLKQLKSRLTYLFSVNHFYNGIPGNTISGIGPALGIQKSLSEKVQASFNASVIRVNSRLTDNPYFATNAQANMQWNINKSNRILINTGLVRNQSHVFFNGNLGYNYTFN